MAEEEKGKTIPAGAPLPPEKDTGEKKTEAPKATVKVGDKEYESPEKLAEAYQNLEGKLGEQGTEVGDLRAANRVLTEQIESAQRAAKTEEGPEKPATDYEAQLTAIYKQVNDGDISVEEAMQKSNALTAETATAQAVEQSTVRFEETLQDRDAEAIQKQFLKDNPDFAELRDSGALKVIREGPGGEMHDDFSAYHALKATQAFDKGKLEAAKLAAGDDTTKTVLTKPGESIQQTNKPKGPLSEPDLEASMLGAALNKGAPGGEG